MIASSFFGFLLVATRSTSGGGGAARRQQRPSFRRTRHRTTTLACGWRQHEKDRARPRSCRRRWHPPFPSLLLSQWRALPFVSLSLSTLSRGSLYSASITFVSRKVECRTLLSPTICLRKRKQLQTSSAAERERTRTRFQSSRAREQGSRGPVGHCNSPEEQTLALGQTDARPARLNASSLASDRTHVPSRNFCYSISRDFLVQRQSPPSAEESFPPTYYGVTWSREQRVDSKECTTVVLIGTSATIGSRGILAPGITGIRRALLPMRRMMQTLASHVHPSEAFHKPMASYFHSIRSRLSRAEPAWLVDSCRRN